MVKDSSASAGDIGTWAGSLGWEEPSEEGMAAHSSILAWRLPWMGEHGRLQSTGSQTSRIRFKRPSKDSCGIKIFLHML